MIKFAGFKTLCHGEIATDGKMYRRSIAFQPTNLVNLVFLTLFAFSIICIFTKPASAAITCAGLPHDEGDTQKEPWHFDVDAKTCGSFASGARSPTNGFSIETDESHAYAL